MTRRFLLAALLGVVPALAADLPTVDQIIDHYVEATGGKAAYEKIHSEHVTGTLDFAAMGIKGKIERWAAEPSQYYATLDIAGIGKTEMGYTDGVAWEKSAVLGVRVKSGDELAQAMREATMHATMNWLRHTGVLLANKGLEVYCTERLLMVDAPDQRGRLLMLPTCLCPLQRHGIG